MYLKLVYCQRKKGRKIQQTTNFTKIVWKQAYQRILVYIIWAYLVKQAYQRILVYIIWAKLKKQEYQCILVYIIYA